jgi:hypothetical protein
MSPDDADSQHRIAKMEIGGYDVGVEYVCNCTKTDGCFVDTLKKAYSEHDVSAIRQR